MIYLLPKLDFSELSCLNNTWSSTPAPMQPGGFCLNAHQMFVIQQGRLWTRHSANCLLKGNICLYMWKFLTLSVCLRFNGCNACKGCTYELFLGLLLQEGGWLIKRQKLGRIVMKRREFGCSDVIQVFSVPLPPGLCRERWRAFRRLTWGGGTWGRGVTFVGQSRKHSLEDVIYKWLESTMKESKMTRYWKKST